MKAPDKICVAPHQIFDYDLDIQEVGHNGAEDYIRKDYLLEWAKGEQNKCSDETHPYAMFMNVVINKLNEI